MDDTVGKFLLVQLIGLRMYLTFFCGILIGK